MVTLQIEDVDKKLESIGPDKRNLTEKRDYLNDLLDKIKELKNDKEVDQDKLKDFETNVKKKLHNNPNIIKGDQTAEYTLGYETFQSSLEPVYYWIYDALKGPTFGLKYDLVAKTRDEFAAAEASAFYGELGRRRTELEKRASELMGTINMVVKSILNLIYDLKEFELRLDEYKKLHSDEEAVSNGADYALKTIWLTEVDSKKGPGSINSLVQNLNYVMLRDAFFSIHMPVGEADKVEKDVLNKIQKELDVPDMIKRILQGRVKEYLKWRELSEKELDKRYKIERTYLKAQVNSLKLYTKWARPYMIATQKLLPAELAAEDMGELPTTFNTMLTFLDLFAKKKVKIAQKPGSSDVIKVEKYTKLKKVKDEEKEEEKDNDVYSVLEVKFVYRVLPGGQTQEGYRGHLGNVDVKIVGYEMQQKDLDNLEIARQNEVISLVDEVTKDTLDALEDDIKRFLGDEDKGEKKETKSRKHLGRQIDDTINITKKHFGDIKEQVQKISNVVNSLSNWNAEQQTEWNTQRLRKLAKEKSKKDAYMLIYLYKKLHSMLTWD